MNKLDVLETLQLQEQREWYLHCFKDLNPASRKHAQGLEGFVDQVFAAYQQGLAESTDPSSSANCLLLSHAERGGGGGQDAATAAGGDSFHGRAVRPRGVWSWERLVW